MRKCSLALVLCLLVEACALVRNEQAVDASSELIGRRRAEIMACAGIPDQDETHGGREIATYSVANRHTASGVVLSVAECTVRIEFERGRVSNVSYTTLEPGVLAPLESCAEIVAGCLR
ncbi:MAG TPA: hypothetical protein VME69_04525 [Methylocella sp.]|nr:hypothetical protein [Methylocella sp.]